MERWIQCQMTKLQNQRARGSNEEELKGENKGS